MAILPKRGFSATVTDPHVRRAEASRARIAKMTARLRLDPVVGPLACAEGDGRITSPPKSEPPPLTWANTPVHTLKRNDSAVFWWLPVTAGVC